MTQVEVWRELLAAAKGVLRDTYDPLKRCDDLACESGVCAAWRRLRATIAEAEAWERPDVQAMLSGDPPTDEGWFYTLNLRELYEAGERLVAAGTWEKRDWIGGEYRAYYRPRAKQPAPPASPAKEAT